MAQGFRVPAPQPEPRALPRESLCKASDPRTLRGRCKVSLKGMKSRLATILIVPFRDSLGTGLHYCSEVSTKPYLFILPYRGFKNGSSQILGLFQSVSPFRTFQRSDSFSRSHFPGCSALCLLRKTRAKDSDCGDSFFILNCLFSVRRVI